MTVRRFLPVLLAPALAGCSLHGCGNRVLTILTAPEGRHAAVLFVRDCGATTGSSHQVSLVRPGEMPAEAGNVFVAGGEDLAPQVEWLGPDRLLITHPRRSPPIILVRERDGVRIDHRERTGVIPVTAPAGGFD